MKTRLFNLTIAMTMLGGVTVADAAEKIVLGELNWAGSKVLTHVLKTVIDANFNVETEIVQSSNAIIYEAMDRGAGEIDIHTNVWFPSQISFTSNYVDEKKTVELTPPLYDTMIGTCIPGFTQDEYGIKSVENLSKPEIAKVFDSDGDGKGEWYPGPTGDQSTALERVKARDYGFSPFFTEINMDHDVFNGVLQTSMEKKQGVLFLCWQPHWIWKAFDLRVVEEPPYEEGCLDGMVYPNDDPDWFEKSKAACGNAPGIVRLAYSASLNERAPEIVEFLNRVKIDTQTASNWIYDISIGDNRPEVSDYAKQWVADNQELVDTWLGL